MEVTDNGESVVVEVLFVVSAGLPYPIRVNPESFKKRGYEILELSI